MTCHCCSGPTKRFGHFKNKNRIVQRYRCVRCAKTFSESQPVDGVRVEFSQAVQVVKLLVEGCGIRAISRLTGLNQKTVLNILESAGEHCARFLDAKIQNVQVDNLEIDEYHSFVRTLQQNTEQGDDLHGDQYTFLALERNSKLIVHYHIGKRDSENTRLFLAGLKARLADRFQLTSDSFNAYHGYLGAVFQAFRENIDYATEQKFYATRLAGPQLHLTRRENPVICKRVKRTPRIGFPDPGFITVNHVERFNLSVRLFNRRFTRKTLGYSKTLGNLKHSVAILVAHFNFCRVHSAHKWTPAQANGLADDVWSVEKLLKATI